MRIRNYRNLLLLRLACSLVITYPLHATTVQPTVSICPAEIHVPDLTINRVLLTHHPAIQQFIADKLRGNSPLQNLFFEIIRSSRKDQLGRTVEKAAANSATLLNTANVSFSEKDLSGVNIPGADLSQGIFDGTKFHGADLTGVNFQGAWLDNSEFDTAILSNVHFAEFTHLNLSHTIHYCCYSLDGRFFSVAYDKYIALFHADTMKKMGDELKKHTDTVNMIAFSSNGEKLASGSNDNRILIWNCIDGRCEQELIGHRGWVHSIAFSPSGNQLASGGNENTIFLWNAMNGRIEKKLDRSDLHDVVGLNCVWSLSFSPNGEKLACGSNNKVHLWDCSRGLIDKTFSEHTKEVRCVAFSPSEKKLASGGTDGTILLWNYESGNIDKRLFVGYMFSLAFSPNGKQLASASSDSIVRLWNCQSGTLDKTFAGHKKAVYSVVFNPSGKKLASGSRDGTVRFWDCAPNTADKTWTAHTSYVSSVTFSPDGQRLASSGGSDNLIQIWNCTFGTVDKIFIDHENGIRCIAFSPNGMQLISGGGDNIVRIWNCLTGKIEKKLIGHIDRIESVAFSPNGEQLASGSSDNTVRLWNYSLGTSKELIGHTACVQSIAFSPNGDMIASGSNDNTIRLWNCRFGIPYKTLGGPTQAGNVLNVVFSPNGEKLASANVNGTVLLWDWVRGTVDKQLGNIFSLTGHTRPVSCVAFSPDGRKLASVSMDKTLRLWDIQTSQEDIYKEIHSEALGISWSPFNYIATGHQDRSVRYWKILDRNRNFCFQLLWSSHQFVLSTHNIHLKDNEKTLSDDAAVFFNNFESEKSANNNSRLKILQMMNENSFALCKKAAEQGNTQAQYNLGVMYETACGTIQSLGDAIAWYAKAALNGHRQASEKIRNFLIQLYIVLLPYRDQILKNG